MIRTRIRAIRIEAEDIRSFELVAESGTLPPWSAGAHVQVEVAPGLHRAYSLCNHTGETDCYRIAVKREPDSRGGSRAMHAFAVGEHLRVSAPRNLFALDTTARTHVLLAGGIGLTPLYAMANALAGSPARVELHVFARGRTWLPFSERLAPESQLHLGLSSDAVATQLACIVAAHAADPRTTFYCCGPAPFMDCAHAALAAAGVAPSRLRSERFGSSAPIAPSAEAETEGFIVRFARSGVEARVAPGHSVLAIGRAHGVEIPSSCEMGVCGACQSQVLAGEAKHCDQYLSEAEHAQGAFLPCVSRCRGELLVLDR